MRPRFRQTSVEGSSREVELISYRVAKDPPELQARIVLAIVSGASTRGVRGDQAEFSWSPKVKCFAALAGSKFVEQLRGKDIRLGTLCVPVLDGIRLSKD